MNIPPPRHAPLSLPLNRHAFENNGRYTKDETSVDTLALPIAITPEDTGTWEDTPPQGMPFGDEGAARQQGQPYAERRASLARLALASGTGEDVATFDSATSRPRIRLEGKALQALALLLAVILAGTWIYLGIDGKKVQEGTSGSPVPSQSDSAQHEPSSSPDSTDGTKWDSSADIVVYISGAVVTPGVYTLPAGSRVNNCVEAAGGLKPDAQSALVNLASTLSDGEHVHIPARGEEALAMNSSAGAGEAGGGSGKININTASAAQLEDLPGIGPALSQTIVTWREDNGRFTSPEDLLEVSGIGQAKYAKLKDLVTVG